MAHRFEPTPATEDLSSLLQDVPEGSHLAVRLGPLGLDVARLVALEASRERRAVPVFVGSGLGGAAPDEPSLDAVLRRLASRGARHRFAIVDAEACIARSLAGHLEAEARAAPPSSDVVLCLYTEKALAAAGAAGPGEALGRHHALVASPGRMPPA